MVFRCRPKPNLAAAKKASVSKPPPSSNEAEKQSASVKENVDKKPALTPLAPTLIIKPETPTPVPLSTPTTSTPNELNSPPPAVSSTCSVAEIPSKIPTSLVSAADSPVSNATYSVCAPLPSTHAVPRPPAKLTADSPMSSVDDSESPLFIPQRSKTLLLSKPTASSEARPPPATEKAVKPRRVPFEPTIDLDEADNEASEEEEEEKPLPVPPRKRSRLEGLLTSPKKGGKRRRRESSYQIRSAPMICGPPDRSKVKMRDLIYRHNQTEPPPQYRQERELKQKGRNGCLWMFHQGAPESAAAASDESSKEKSSATNSTSSPADVKLEKKPDVEPEKKPDVKPAQTQFVMDADGNIVLNEESLVIRREYTDADYIDIKQDSFMGNATYSSYRDKKPRSKKWTIEENIRLYKALSTIGTDFSCMVRLFKNRTREEIKRKFKREEKLRPQLIDHVLSNRKSFDLSLLDHPDDDLVPIISSDSDSSSDSDEDVLQKAVLNLDDSAAKEKLYRRQKRFKRIDLEASSVPGHPSWYSSKTAYQSDSPPVKRLRPDHSAACGVVCEAVEALKRSRGQSMDHSVVTSPAPAPSPSPSAPGGVEDVLSRLIGQKMRDVSQRPTTPITPICSPSPTRNSPLPAPSVRNSSLSLTEFCKMEAHVDS